MCGRESELNILIASILKLAKEQLIGRIIKFVDEWHGEELKILQCIQGKEKGKVMEIEREDTIIVTHPDPACQFIADKTEWFEDYIVNDYDIIHDWHSEDMDNNRKEVKKLGRSFSYVFNTFFK